MVTQEILTTCCCSGQLIHKIVPGTTQPYVGEDAEQFRTRHTPLDVCHVSVSPAPAPERVSQRELPPC